jgi:hypothetical protein
MLAKTTVERAKKDLREGKSPTTAAGEFVHEEIEHVRRGKHGARSPKQAIAIGLSKARRAGVPLPPPAKGKPRRRQEGAQRAPIARGRRTRRNQHGSIREFVNRCLSANRAALFHERLFLSKREVLLDGENQHHALRVPGEQPCARQRETGRSCFCRRDSRFPICKL